MFILLIEINIIVKLLKDKNSGKIFFYNNWYQAGDSTQGNNDARRAPYQLHNFPPVKSLYMSTDTYSFNILTILM